MRLLIVVPTLHKGGVERVVSVLSQECIKGNDIKIIVFDARKVAYPFGGDLIDLKLPAMAGNFFKIFQFIRRLIKLSMLFKNEILEIRYPGYDQVEY